MASEEKQPEVNPVGRPSCYRAEYEEQVHKLALLGATDKEIGDFFNVTETTINNWKIAFPEFFESIKRGKIQADAEVAEKLFERAKGYEHPETKVFCHEGDITTYEVVKHYPPDTAAAFIWLKNRRMWTDRQDFTTGGEKIAAQIVLFSDVIKPKEEVTPEENVDTE